MRGRNLWLSLLCSASAALAAGPRLTNPRRVFPTGGVTYKRPTQRHVWAMRLSPSGRHVLYSRPKGEPPAREDGTVDWHKAKYELVLRDLSSGKDAVLPLGPIESGWQTGLLRFGVFDPAGTRLAPIRIEVQREQVGEGVEAVRSATKVLLYDIATGKVTPTGLEGPMVMARFDRTGKGLIVMKATGQGWGLFTAALPKLELRPRKAVGFPNAVCPGADVVCMWAPPQRKRPTEPGRRPERTGQRLFLHDLAADKEIADLPVHERNSVLDDLECQWTPDGRYLCYYDVREEPAEAGSRRRPKLRVMTRIWDRRGGREARRVPDAIPLGPGPGPSSIMLVKRQASGDGPFLLHDAKNGSEWPLGDATVRPIHAHGRKVVYAKVADDGTEAVYVADVVGAEAKAPKTP